VVAGDSPAAFEFENLAGESPATTPTTNHSNRTSHTTQFEPLRAKH